jgi:hypothetical protein
VRTYDDRDVIMMRRIVVDDDDMSTKTEVARQRSRRVSF